MTTTARRGRPFRLTSLEVEYVLCLRDAGVTWRAINNSLPEDKRFCDEWALMTAIKRRRTAV